MAMSKVNQKIAESMSVEMQSYSTRKWETALKEYAAKRIAADSKGIFETAVKLYLKAVGKDFVETKEHKFLVYMKRGATYVDYQEMLADFAELVGVSVDELERKYTKRRPDTETFSFK